ncbi:MAG: hypothetical protein JWO13_1715 [Acidobacteriales bacterium]|nr:hypothetical protein [Terriglobales bacterium]
MKLSVVIATFNRRNLLARTLPTVLDQDFPPSQYEVVIVDDGSTDDSHKLLESFSSDCKLTLLRKPNEGQGIALAHGAAAAQGEILLFLDDDIVCPRNLISEHVAAHSAAAGNVVVSGPVDISPESPPNVATDWIRHADATYKQNNVNAKERAWPADCKLDANSSISRSLLLDSGGFNPEFSPARFDLELGLRLHRRGVRFLLHRNARAEQIYVKSPQSLMTDAALYAAKELTICRLYPEYRAVSAFARLNEGPLLKRTTRKLIVRTPFSAKILASAARMTRSVQLLQAAYTTNLLRTAARSTTWESFHAEFGMQLPVLLYHHVGPLRAGTFPTLSVSPERFRSQIEWLSRNGYQTTTTTDWLLWSSEGKPLPKKPVLLTFDDGYKDLAEFAFPILKEFGFGATVFIVTSQIGGTNDWDQRNGSAAHALLSADEIIHWSRSGIEFGSHSVTHPDMTSLNETDLRTQSEDSARSLSGLLGTQADSFAYPYGGVNPAVREALSSKYRLAFTTEVGLNHLGSDLFSLTRTMVQSKDSLFDLRLRLIFGWNPIEGIRRRIAQLRGRVPKPDSLQFAAPPR